MENLIRVRLEEVALAEKSALVGGVRALGESMTGILNFSFGLLLEPYDTRWPMNMSRKLFAKVMEYVP